MSSSDLFLTAAAFVTSALAAVAGLGGGVVLIALMPDFLPPQAVIPVHGVVQITSNVSRTLLGLRHIEWPLVRDYAAGALLGALLGSRLLARFSWDHLPLVLGVFILLFTWLPKPARAPRLPGRFAMLGALQTALSLFIGVSGPLNMPFLLREGLGRDRTIITHAVQMTAMHLLKVATFGLLGFTFAPYLTLVLGMVVGASLGSWAGTHLRGRVPEAWFRHGVRALVTLLALRLLGQGVLRLGAP